MKFGLTILLLLLGCKLHAQSVQVPEDCLRTEETPCLAHVKSFTDQPLPVGQYDVRTTSDTIMKWNSFQGEVDVELIKGKFYLNHVKKTRSKASHEAHEKPVALAGTHGAPGEAGHEAGHGDSVSHEDNHGSAKGKKKVTGENTVAKDEKLRINGVLMTSFYVLVQKDQDVLKVFDLKNFSVSEYDLSQPKHEPNLIKTHFADKTELVYLSAPFFKTRNRFLTFLKVIEKPFDKKLSLQAAEQTKVLSRTLASVELRNKEADEKKAAEDAKLKKVRELFFYRTFYR